jgi:uncharacterized protein (TIGR02145 family)
MKPLFWIVLLITISTFSQTPGGGVTDIDGNRYNSVIIGTQEWMKENLNVSKYTDGTIIPQVTDPAAWTSLTTGAWCYYNNDPANGAIYGKLYNLYAVLGIHSAASFSDPSLRKELSPTGWRVSVNRVDADEWTILSDYLGGLSIAGGKMKEIGTSHWTSPNAGATNSSGFTALPGGYRESNGIFWEIGKYGFWWPHMWRNDFINNRSLYLGYLSSSLIPSSGLGDIRMGLSIRCIKNGNLVNQSFNNNNQFNIFPNPAKDQITIDLGTNSNAIGWSYKIVNTLGQEVLNGVLSSQQNIIALNNIKGQGVYFVKVYDGSNALLDTKKIIIQQ